MVLIEAIKHKQYTNEKEQNAMEAFAGNRFKYDGYPELG